MPYDIDLVQYPPADDVALIGSHLMRFNSEKIGPSDYTPFAIFVRSEGAVLGGLSGRVWWRWMYVEKFWLSQDLRGKGIGSQLLELAETYARGRNCVGVNLDTIDEDARAFYERHGYDIFGVLEGFPPGRRQWFLRKDLQEKE